MLISDYFEYWQVLAAVDLAVGVGTLFLGRRYMIPLVPMQTFLFFSMFWYILALNLGLSVAVCWVVFGVGGAIFMALSVVPRLTEFFGGFVGGVALVTYVMTIVMYATTESPNAYAIVFAVSLIAVGVLGGLLAICKPYVGIISATALSGAVGVVNNSVLFYYNDDNAISEVGAYLYIASIPLLFIVGVGVQLKVTATAKYFIARATKDDEHPEPEPKVQVETV